MCTCARVRLLVAAYQSACSIAMHCTRQSCTFKFCPCRPPAQGAHGASTSTPQSQPPAPIWNSLLSPPGALSTGASSSSIVVRVQLPVCRSSITCMGTMMVRWLTGLFCLRIAACMSCNNRGPPDAEWRARIAPLRTATTLLMLVHLLQSLDLAMQLE